MGAIRGGSGRRSVLEFEGELRLLEMIASGVALDDVLCALRRFVEARWGEACRCRVLLASQLALHAGRLETRAGRSCASVHSTCGELLGSVVVSHHTTPQPVSRQRDLLRKIVHIARIAIERARSDAALRRSEWFLAEAQRLSSTGSFSWRIPGDEIYWSDQLYRLFDFEPGGVVTLERICDRTHPDDRDMMAKMMDKARKDGDDLEFGHRIVMADKTVRHLHLVARGLRDGRGGVEFLGAVQDVTQRRTSEEALGRARAELAHVARVASLGALTASISHEVNQPLCGVVTNAGLSLRLLDRDPADVSGARDAIRRALDDGARATQVILRLRALFRRRDVELEPVDLNDAASEVVSLSQLELQRKRVTVEMLFAGCLPMVTGDRIQLQQVIPNLLMNAADSMASIEDRPRVVRIETGVADDAQVELRVRDSGPGLDPEVRSRMFEAFYSTKAGGMGIGLFISRSIVEGHRGRLHVAANQGPGVTFSFRLPQASVGRFVGRVQRRQDSSHNFAAA